MRKIKDGRTGSKYTLECKLEAVRLVNHGQSVPVTHYWHKSREKVEKK